MSNIIAVMSIKPESSNSFCKIPIELTRNVSIVNGVGYLRSKHFLKPWVALRVRNRGHEL